RPSGETHFELGCDYRRQVAGGLRHQAQEPRARDAECQAARRAHRQARAARQAVRRRLPPRPIGRVMRRLLFLAVFLNGCAAAPPASLERIDTIVVIYAENRSFDHLYGLFPGAEGIAQASPEQKTQLDHDGRALPYLPGSYDPSGKPRPDLQTRGLPNGPFRIDQPPIGRTMAERLPNPVHNYYQNREQ